MAPRALLAGLLTAAAVAACAPVASAASPAEAVGLRADHLRRPLGIDNPHPLLSWRLESERRGERQTAYQVQVASSGQQLASGEPDVWDSGRVESAESTGVRYDGPQLQAGGRYEWRVRVWDGDGEATDWSVPRWWEMALLTEQDWGDASWIRPLVPGGIDAAAWTDYTIDVDFSIASGSAGVVFRARDALNHYMWQINASGSEVALRPHVQIDGEWSVLDYVPIGDLVPESAPTAEHHLQIAVSGESIETRIDGQLVDSREDSSFSGGTIGFRSGDSSEDASFDDLQVSDVNGETLFEDDFESDPDPAFPGAQIEAGAIRVAGGDTPLLATEPEVSLLRKDFALNPGKEVASARIYAYGLGLYDLRLSGSRVGDRVLTPAVSSFSYRSRYQTYDVTDLLAGDANTLALRLAPGYGKTFSEHGWRWLGPRQALVRLEVVYADGSRQSVVSDDSWHWSDGPLRAADIYDGETYDARLERTGWDEPGYDDSDWGTVQTVAAPSPRLEADPTPPIRVAETLRPVSVAEPEPGVYVFDLGQNIAGWARLTASGPEGAQVRMRYAENVDENGALDTHTNRNAAATDTYILAGRDEPETYEPAFTYHGFRYVEVTGLSGPATLDTIAGRAVHASLRGTSSFESSSSLLNKIYANGRWTMLNNAMSYPTDNPVRDERTGPPMDIQAYLDAAVRDFDASRFFAAYQEEAGPGYGGSPDMRGTYVPLAWALYEQYGDRERLEQSYPRMAEYVDSLEAVTDDGIWPDDEETGFGDWCPPLPAEEVGGGVGSPDTGGYWDCFSEVSLVNTALYFRAARIVARAAGVLGNDGDAEHYEALAGEIATAFEQHFLNAEQNGYGSGRQVTSVLPLAFGMVPAEHLAAVRAELVRTVVEDDDGHLDTGIFGTRFLVDVLVDAGRPDVAFGVLTKQGYPGFGYQVGMGATTIWEQWAYRASMGSHDHAMFAGVNASILTRLAGINPSAATYRTIEITPAIPPGLPRAAASIDTVRGRVASAWERDGDRLSLDVTIPPNATAEVTVPVDPTVEVRESGVPAAESEGVELARTEEDHVVYAVGAGEYRFTAGPDVVPEPPVVVDPLPPREDGPSSPQPPGRPRVKLKLGARQMPRGKVLLTVRCAAGCPRGRHRLSATVRRADGRGRSRRARIVLRHGRGQVRLPAHWFAGRRWLRVTIRDLGGRPLTFKVRVRRPAG